MNFKRFTARTSREALALVREALGSDAVVLSTRPCADGVEVLAMNPDGMQQIERMSSEGRVPVERKPSAATRMLPRQAAAVPPLLTDVVRREPVLEEPAGDDVQQLAMSTLSFQDYVRERMLRRRSAQADTEQEQADASSARGNFAAGALSSAAPTAARPKAPAAGSVPEKGRAVASTGAPALSSHMTEALRAAERAATPERSEAAEMMAELRSMKGLIEQRFASLAFVERLQRQPAQARMAHRLIEAGFSPALVRKMVDALPADIGDDDAWACRVLEHNLQAAEQVGALEDMGGVFALIGSTGVGKTTTTAKIAAAFAARHGAAQLGLITLDAYRVGAQEQLRAYGRILGVPVHTAHDRESLEDLLQLLSEKKMVLIDTAGMAQRDSRTRELLDMISHRSIQRLIVINAASQGEAIEDVMVAWRASACRGVVISKMDEAVRLAPVLDTLIRHKLRVVGVANGQRVPEDWHRLSAQALVQRALRGGGTSQWRLQDEDMMLMFSGIVRESSGTAQHRPTTTGAQPKAAAHRSSLSI